jgi:hypothetical protein
MADDLFNEAADTVSEMTADTAHFRRYLLRELLWELSESRIEVPGLTDVPPEEIDVTDFRGYDAVTISVRDRLLRAGLSWRPDMPPTLDWVEDRTP